MTSLSGDTQARLSGSWESESLPAGPGPYLGVSSWGTGPGAPVCTFGLYRDVSPLAGVSLAGGWLPLGGQAGGGSGTLFLAPSGDMSSLEARRSRPSRTPSPGNLGSHRSHNRVVSLWLAPWIEFQG